MDISAVNYEAVFSGVEHISIHLVILVSTLITLFRIVRGEIKGEKK